MEYRLYARGAAVAFAAVSVYTVLVKVPGGEFSRDWVHTALHLATGAVAVYAGWIAAGPGAAAIFTAGLGLAYGALGVVGWFVDGVLMGTRFRVPLDAADNVFHLLLAGAAGLVVLLRTRAGPA